MLSASSSGFFLHVVGQRFPLLWQFNVTKDRRLTETSLQDETACKGTTSIFL